MRVPFEVVKQRSQANRSLKPAMIVRHALSTEVGFGFFCFEG